MLSQHQIMDFSKTGLDLDASKDVSKDDPDPRKVSTKMADVDGVAIK